MSRKLLPESDLTTALTSLPGWTITNGKLHRQYTFSGFPQAFGFMATAAPTIEKRDHHPEWSNVYNRVTVDLSTHDAGGITQLDVNLAKLLEGIAQKLL